MGIPFSWEDKPKTALDEVAVYVELKLYHPRFVATALSKRKEPSMETPKLGVGEDATPHPAE
jgi:hypothetical protein